jgi:hypothetical protein
MTFRGFLPEWFLITAAALIGIARVFTLWQMLRQGRGSSLRTKLRRWGRWTAITAALFAVVLAAAGPVTVGSDIVETEVEHTKQIKSDGGNLNVYLVVDRSIASLARDEGPGEGTQRQSRINAIRNDAVALLEKFPQARFSLVDGGRSAEVEWPLSRDLYTLGSTLRGLPPYDIGPVSDSGNIEQADALLDVDRGAAAPLLQPSVNYQRTAFPERVNLVVYFGCGESAGVKRPQTSFGDVAGLFDGGVVLGYGTQDGGQVLTSPGQGQHKVGLSADGSPLAFKYDEAVMRRLADELAVPYVHRDVAKNPNEIFTALTGPAKPRPAAHLSATVFPLYWALLLFAASVGLAECYRSVRDRSRMSWVAKAVREGTA